jgi:hypothetical protein
MEHRYLGRFVPQYRILLEWRWGKKRPERGGGDALIYLGEHLTGRNNTLAGNSGESEDNKIKKTLLTEMYRNFYREVQQCAPANSIVRTDVRMLNASDVSDFALLYNTLFIDFSTQFLLLCP